MSGEESQFNVQGYNIVTILKRLEAATSRLEDITIFQEEANVIPDGKAGAIDGEKKKSIESGAAGAGAGAGSSAPSAPAKPLVIEESKQVKAFKEYLEEHVKPFTAKSKEVDTLVGQAASTLADAFEAQVKFLTIVDQAKKPDMSSGEFLELINPINSQIEKLNNLKESNRRSEYFNHLSTLSEGAPVLGWILSNLPVPMISEFKDSAQFWSNRVIKDYKEKDPKQAEWAKQFIAIFEPLKAYVKEYHTTGPAWNNKDGKNISEVLSKAPVSAAPPAAGGSAPPPPPPPPPPASIFEDDGGAAKSAPASGGGMNAVFADLNKGEGITSGLKKVDKSEMTHKNPALRQQAAAKKPTPPKKPTNLSSAPSTSAPKKKPAKKELVDGTKWIIENFTDADVPANQPITIEAEMHQSIFIGNTSGITIQVKGKANAISLSETRNTGVVVDSLISGIDVIKSYKYGLQVLEVVPMISIDKSDEGTIYLSQASVDADTQIFTSSTTALNINVPQDDDYSELAVPEQFKHTIKNGQLVSEVVEHAG